MTPRCAVLRRRVPRVPAALDEFYFVRRGRNQVGNLVNVAIWLTVVDQSVPQGTHEA